MKKLTLMASISFLLFVIGCAKDEIKTADKTAQKTGLTNEENGDGNWTQRANFIKTRLSSASFSIGNKGYVGLGLDSNPQGNGFIAYSEFWQYDPAFDSWSQIADVPTEGRFDAIAFATSTKGYIGLGRNSGFKIFQDLWEYNVSTNAWHTRARFPGMHPDKAVAFSIHNKGYVGTGSCGQIYLKDFMRFDPDKNKWEGISEFPGSRRSGAISLATANKGFVGFGYNTAEGGLNDFYEYDPLTDVWTQKASIDEGERFQPSGFTIGENVYIFSGSHGRFYPEYGQIKNDFWKYNITTGVWVKQPAFPLTPRMDAAWFNIGNKGYIGGGIYFPDMHKSMLPDFWEFSEN
ncbi:MAG: type sorting protein [Sphingobacteriales bacterium]|nr:type sorting protein [Sphingobacteriales bacterium]